MDSENKGIIIVEPKFTDWQFGGYTPLQSKYLNPTGDWTPHLPVIEYQNSGSFDRMACVTYSFLNCLEILHIFQTGQEINYSDRFLAKLSGTTHSGNSLSNVAQTAKNNGLVKESDYMDVLDSWEDYYKDLTPQLITLAKEFLKEWDIYYEWVNPDDKDAILDALRYAPLQVVVKYWSGEGILNPIGNYNHAVTVFNTVQGQYWEIYDHYTQTRKKYAWDYKFGSILKLTLNKKSNIIPMKLNNNTLVFKTQGDGYNFALYLDGKLMIGETADVLGLWIMRDGKDKKSVTLADWNSIPHYDLKGNKIA